MSPAKSFDTSVVDSPVDTPEQTGGEAVEPAATGQGTVVPSRKQLRVELAPLVKRPNP